MVKKWIDANLIADAEYVTKDLYRYEDIMKQIPNFDKTEGAKKIYSRKEYIILRVKKGYIVYNKHKKFKEGHTHIKNYNMCKTIIDNCINQRKPKTTNIYLLESHKRISNNKKYINEIENIINEKVKK